MPQFKYSFVFVLLLSVFVTACGGGSSGSASSTVNSTQDTQEDTTAGATPTGVPVMMFSQNADLSEAAPLQNAALTGMVKVFFLEGSDWPTRGVKRVVFYCCKNSSSPHTVFPADTTSPYGIDLNLNNYQDGTYELYVDVFFNDQYAPEPFFIYFKVRHPAGSTPNTAPNISGSPALQVTENNNYQFIPGAFDADGDSLNFSVVNLPSWASFNISNGQVSGTPSSANIGVYSNIIISVSDGTDTVSLPAFNISVTSAPVAQNSAPTISGSAATSVNTGEMYSFTPIAADADGDTLVFSVVNLPVWASFNNSTGQISGTPGTGDVGTYSNIVISVSDSIASTALPAFSINVQNAPAPTVGSASLSWTAPTTYTDGSPISSLGGYKIYYGTSVGNYPSSVDVAGSSTTSHTIDNLPGNTTYYFVVTAYDANGVESSYSNSVSKFVP